MENEIANTIAGNLSLSIDSAQYERRNKLSTSQLTAYDWQLRGNRSIELGGRGHYAMSCARGLKAKFELADQHATRSPELNPSEYHNICCRGYTQMSLNNFGDSVDSFSESLRRNPLSPNSCLLALGLMEYVSDNHAQAAIAFSRMLPGYLQKRSSMAAAFGQLGYARDANSAAKEFQRVARSLPDLPTGNNGNWPGFWSKVYPYLGPNNLSHLLKGLRAGLPV